MIKKLQGAKWLQPIWWLAVLYIWFGSLYPFLFGSHDLGQSIIPSPRLTVAYAMLLAAGIVLFGDKTLFRRIFLACRILQTLALLLLLLLTHISFSGDLYIALISGLLILPYIGMYTLHRLPLQLILILYSLALTVITFLKGKK